MSVTLFLAVCCDEPNCAARFDSDEMTKTVDEARYFAIECGWQSIMENSAYGAIRREYCQRHRLAPKEASVSVHRKSFEVTCDEPGCKESFKPDDMIEIPTEARYLAIGAGWQVVTRDGRGSDCCPKHHRPAPKEKS